MKAVLGIMIGLVALAAGSIPYYQRPGNGNQNGGNNNNNGHGHGHGHSHSNSNSRDSSSSSNSFESNESDLSSGGGDGGNGGSSTKFAENFMFAAGSSAFQVEGGWNADGKGPSIWDIYTQTSGRVVGNANANTAANSYNFYNNDINAVKGLGAKYYKFSFSWSRILPNGDASSRNQAAINYYNNVLNAMIANNIQPIVTMYNWDLPQRLQDLGGWSNPLMVGYFVDYANVLFSEFGGKVKYWITFNNPAQQCLEGYGDDIQPPSIDAHGVGEYLCAHHTILAHAQTYRLYKSNYNSPGGRVGITLKSMYFYPLDSSTANSLAAENARQFYFGWFANPIFSSVGDYPAIMRQIIGDNSRAENRTWSRLPFFSATELTYIRGSADFVGLSYFTSRRAAAVAASSTTFKNPSLYRDLSVELSIASTWTTRAKSDWLYSVPDGLTQMLAWIRTTYNNPDVIVTENGWSDNGEVTDTGRIDYLRSHLKAILTANAAGSKVIGYSCYSLMDQFEWRQGYSDRFGLYRIDFTTTQLTRTEKKSCEYYRSVCQTRVVT